MLRFGIETARKNARLAVDSPALLRSVVQVRRRRLTYLSEPAVVDLALAAREIEKNQRPGLIVEAGTALGGSAIILALAKNSVRPMRAYDMFGMIPPPGEEDGPDVHARYQEIVAGSSSGIGGDTYYGYRPDLLNDVRASFDAFGIDVGECRVDLVAGLFQDTMAINEPIALAHLDGDWYESTKTCLDRIAPWMAVASHIIIDDYDDWSGCRRAVDEFLASALGGQYETRRRSRLHLVRIRA